MIQFIRKMISAETYDNKQNFKILIENLEAAKCEISQLDASLDYITDPLLMNQIIFERKAAEMRYRYCLKLAKETEVSSD